jgi:hypothetical protein
MTLGAQLLATKTHRDETRRKREEATRAAEKTAVEEYFEAVMQSWTEDIQEGRIPEMAILPQPIVDILDPESSGVRAQDIAHPCHTFYPQWERLMDWATNEQLAVRLDFTLTDSDSCDLALLVDAATEAPDLQAAANQ